MKIKIRHPSCGREVFVQQIVDSGGHCPWDGEPFTRDYTANLARALEQAEAAGELLETALQEVAGMDPNLEVDEGSVLDPLTEHLRSLRRRKAPAGS